MSLSRDNKQGRGPNRRFLPTTSAEEARIIELEAQVSQLQTSNQWNAAESVRLAESLRLAEQGRDKAIAEKNGALGQYEAEFTRATTHMQLRAKAEQENGVLREELQHANLKLDNSKEDLQAATAEIAELSLENTRLEALVMPEESPLLPLWVRLVFAGLATFLVAYLAHRAGFTSAMEAAK